MKSPNSFTPSPELLAMLSSTMTEQQARALFMMGEEAVAFAILTLQTKLQDALNANSQGRPSPSTPSSTIPPHLKPEVKSKGTNCSKRGAKLSHPGTRRQRPEPDKRVELQLEVCPECGAPVKKCRKQSSSHTRCVTDIASEKLIETTEFHCPQFICTRCKKVVEPKVPDALPRCEIGNKLGILTAWLHYANGCTIHQSLELLNHHLSLPLTQGGLVQIWSRLADCLKPWYDEIQTVCNRSGVLHGDETGWNVDGRREWLWCFTTSRETYYFIIDSRGSKAVEQFFNNDWAGVLVTDFWNAYNCVEGGSTQKCLVHLLRELKRVEDYKSTNDNWSVFKQALEILVKKAIQLKRNKVQYPPDQYQELCREIEGELDELTTFQSANSEVKRLVKRLNKYRSSLLTFLYHDSVPFDNNHAERNIRPAVLMRKNYYGNRSEKGAETQAILMSVFQTLKQRKIPPLETVKIALRQLILTGKLPSLNELATS